MHFHFKQVVGLQFFGLGFAFVYSHIARIVSFFRGYFLVVTQQTTGFSMPQSDHISGKKEPLLFFRALILPVVYHDPFVKLIRHIGFMSFVDLLGVLASFRGGKSVSRLHSLVRLLLECYVL